MGNTKKRTKQAKSSKSGRQRNVEAVSAERQVTSVVMFTASVFLFLAAIIPGEAGWAVIHKFILGVFGFFGYIVPVVLGVVAVLIALDKLRGKQLVRIVGVSIIVVLVSAFVNILFTCPESANFGDCIKRAYAAGSSGSGFFGAVFGYPLYAAFKNPGAWIICALLIFATVMILTGTTLVSLYKAISKPVKKTYEAVESVYNENLERRRSAPNIDIPLDDVTPKEPEPKLTIEEKQKSVVKKYRDLDKEEMEDISSDTNGENAAKAAVAAAVSRTASAVSKRADSEFESDEPKGDMADIINKVNADADNKGDIKKLELELSEGSAITIESQTAEYKYPPISLLAEPAVESTKSITAELEQTATLLVDTLRSFGVESRIINISRGPSVTRYELQPAAGVKISKITNLADDIALNLATAGVRIEAPIPNKPAVGIEVPNKNNSIVKIREIIDSQAFSNSKSKISMALGKDISGEQRVTDIAKMPHGLIAGATGSGKSVCINSMIMSILYKATPDEVKLLLIDPKVVELSIYNGIPHLIVPVVTDPRKAAGALGWAVMEMERRYKLFDEYRVRNLSGYNEQAAKRDDMMKLPHIVIVIDELADLMMTSPREVEDSICRIAQKARAAGMHMIVATQRPSVDVVTGLIKANIPTRIAFAVSSQVDSKTIIDIGGAEKLMGKGDMLFFPTGAIKPERIQGCFVSDAEVEKVVNYLKSDHRNEYDEDVMNEIERQAAKEKSAKSGLPEDAVEDDGDSMLEAAIECVVDAGQASTSLLQRKLRLGYARAARIIDQMEERGIVGPYEGSKPRQVLISKERLLEMKAGQSDSE